MKNNKKTAIVVTILVVALLSTLGISFYTGILKTPFEVVGTGPFLNIRTSTDGITWNDSNVLTYTAGTYYMQAYVAGIIDLNSYYIMLKWDTQNLKFLSTDSSGVIYSTINPIVQISEASGTYICRVFAAYAYETLFTGQGTIFKLRLTATSSGTATIRMDINGINTQLLSGPSNDWANIPFKYDTKEVIINDIQAPTIFTPLTNPSSSISTEVPVTITATITDDTSGVDKDRVTLHYNIPPITMVLTTAMNRISGGDYKNAQYSAIISASSTMGSSGTGKIVTYYIDSYDYMGNHVTSPTYSYVTIPPPPVPDTTLPTIGTPTQNPSGSPIMSNQEVTISATVTDNVAVKNASIFVMIGNQAGNWKIIYYPMTSVGAIYTGTILASNTVSVQTSGDATKVKYAVLAYDTSENYKSTTQIQYLIQEPPTPMSHVTITIVGSGTTDRSSGEYTLDSSITITATAADNWHYMHTTRINIGGTETNENNPCTFTSLTTNEAITVLFEADIPPSDNTSPTLSNLEQTPQTVSLSDDVQISITVIDAQSGVKNATLRCLYYLIGQSTSSEDIVMAKSGNVYTATIRDAIDLKSSLGYDISKVEYSIIAYDNAGNFAETGQTYTYDIIPEYTVIFLMIAFTLSISGIVVYTIKKKKL